MKTFTAGVAVLAGLTAARVHRGPGPAREVGFRLPSWPAHLDGLRVAVVGDLRIGAPGRPLPVVAETVRRLRGAGPDVILLLGDYADPPYPPERVAAGLAPLVGLAPVVAILGERDWYSGGVRVRAELHRVGIPVLDTSALCVPAGDGEVWLAGAGEPWDGEPDVERALRDVPANAPAILLTHHSDSVWDVPRSVSLIVTTRAHGGRPVLDRPPFARPGGYDVDGRILYVSPGTRPGLSTGPGDRTSRRTGPVGRLVPVPPVRVLRLWSPLADRASTQLALDGGEC